MLAAQLLALTLLAAPEAATPSKEGAPAVDGAIAPEPAAGFARDAAWRNTRWGMTLDEVLAAVPEATRLAKGEPMADGQVALAAVEGQTLAGLPARVRFAFKDGKLSLVMAMTTSGKAPRAEYDRLQAALASALGQPGEEGRAEASIGLRRTTFRTPGTTVTLSTVGGSVQITGRAGER